MCFDKRRSAQQSACHLLVSSPEQQVAGRLLSFLLLRYVPKNLPIISLANY